MVTGEELEYDFVLGTCYLCHKQCDSNLLAHPECCKQDIARLESIIKSKKNKAMLLTTNEKSELNG